MHLSAEVALDLIEKRASQDQVDFWNGHLLNCAGCTERLQAWQRICSLLKRENLESAPEFLIRAGEALFGPQAAGRSLREVVASLMFDSFAQPALTGARGASAARQLLLSAEGIDVHLRVSTQGNRRRIAGQILPRDKKAELRGATVHLLQQGKRIETAEADRFGEFEFFNITEGPLQLEVELSGLKITGTLE
jgi:hypothetical protein